MVDEVVPCVDVVLPERGEAMEDVMCKRVGLGVEQVTSVVGGRLCGSS